MIGCSFSPNFLLFPGEAVTCDSVAFVGGPYWRTPTESAATAEIEAA
jgi:hypothetical protein